MGSSDVDFTCPLLSPAGDINGRRPQEQIPCFLQPSGPAGCQGIHACRQAGAVFCPGLIISPVRVNLRVAEFFRKKCHQCNHVSLLDNLCCPGHTMVSAPVFPRIPQSAANLLQRTVLQFKISVKLLCDSVPLHRFADQGNKPFQQLPVLFKRPFLQQCVKPFLPVPEDFFQLQRTFDTVKRHPVSKRVVGHTLMVFIRTDYIRKIRCIPVSMGIGTAQVKPGTLQNHCRAALLQQRTVAGDLIITAQRVGNVCADVNLLVPEIGPDRPVGKYIHHIEISAAFLSTFLAFPGIKRSAEPILCGFLQCTGQGFNAVCQQRPGNFRLGIDKHGKQENL